VYRQKTLQDALGARYVHVPALGNANYKGGGPIAIVDLPGGTEAVRALLAHYPAVVLMCVCSDLEWCHRLPVATALGEVLGCAVEHVRLGAEGPQLTLEV
jgi:hypothetical protein